MWCLCFDEVVHVHMVHRNDCQSQLSAHLRHLRNKKHDLSRYTVFWYLLSRCISGMRVHALRKTISAGHQATTLASRCSWS
jgi:hypothetical protein